MLFSVQDITVSTTVTGVQPLFQGKRTEQLLRGSIKHEMQSLDHWLTENNTDLLAVRVLSQNEWIWLFVMLTRDWQILKALIQTV